MAARLDRRLSWVRATGLGSLVVPDENWINATSSSATSISTEVVVPPRLDAITQPTRGAEISTVTPRNRLIRWSVTTRAASTAASMAAVLR
ncbi:hypothetical protein ACVWWN_000135 [Mycobacterium sp. URHB0021]